MMKTFMTILALRVRLTDFDSLPIMQQIAGARYEGVGAFNTAKNFHLGSHVPADHNWNEVDFTIVGYCDDVHATVVDDESTGGNNQGSMRLSQCELYLGIHARQERSITVVDLHFGQHGP